ncbi:tumor necrosis factor ligand superfamily member 10-like isoform X2 [Corythoichthys intestinalis]|uniref:tumor necrosis factor ligand superfamily member 10-like isoform X2 n=1 Tax=Corythoichthys intestinalis TaxID=161448 RepID=UPI0025A6256D|nr:tumor necrosis factor ligand superfamily member 10-like isoform X2 [Corythoichthys intestinalis]XP_061811015.1 tumor necrosis factor ligand superfamily member 10-like [Nerophis lumbriciformis]
MASPSEQQQQQDYFRSVSSESTTYMMVPASGRSPAGRPEAPSKMWVALVVVVVVVLQVASTTGLFVYLNMSISQVRSQGVTEELKCLSLLNALDQDIPEQLAQLLGEPCIKLAEGIKAYISKVTENIISKQTFMVARTMPRSFNNTGSKFLSSVAQRPSAHLTLRDTSSQAGYPQLHQSCRHVVRSWANRSLGAHLHNMTLSNGRLRVPQDGRYYLYSQVYFRYPSPATGEADQRSVSHQLVQCVYKKTSYPSPIQLLKGVGTKCWAPDAEYALHSVYQGGLFELRAGDELFVSVSSPTMLNADDTSSYFGAFRLDL